MDKDAIERTSGHVRAILEAAEASAVETRAEAARQASALIARVEERSAGLLARIEALEQELGALREAVRASVASLTEELAPPPGEDPAPEAGGEDFAAAGGEDFAAAAPAVVDEAPDEPVGADAPAAAAEPEPAARANGDEAGARLIALNMALDGKPREVTARYLTEHFALGDPERLLDDVYARAGK